MEKTMSTKRKYDKQFKKDTIELLLNSGKTATQIGIDLGIRSELISRWKREFNDGRKNPFPGQGNARDEEVGRLKKENAELKMEREILKKALAIFSTPGK